MDVCIGCCFCLNAKKGVDMKFKLLTCVILASLALSACGKKSKTKTNPEDQVGGGDATPAAFDVELKGLWKSSQQGLEMTTNFADNGNGRDEVKADGAVIMAFESTSAVNLGVMPHTLLRTITKVEGTEDIKVGDKAYCIYKVEGNKLTVDCSDNQTFPATFSAEASVYTR